LILSSENQIDKKILLKKTKFHMIFISENQQLDNDSSRNIKLTKIKIDIMFISEKQLDNNIIMFISEKQAEKDND